MRSLEVHLGEQANFYGGDKEFLWVKIVTKIIKNSPIGRGECQFLRKKRQKIFPKLIDKGRVRVV